MYQPRADVTAQSTPHLLSKVLRWSVFAATFLALAESVPAPAAADEMPRPGSHYDRRIEINTEVLVRASASQTAAMAALRAQIPDLQIRVEPTTGAVHSLTNGIGYLTEALPSESFEAEEIARDYLVRHLDLLGLERADLDETELVDRVVSRVSGTTHLYYRQVHLGIPVYNGRLHAHINVEGRILGIDSGFLPALRHAVTDRSPTLDASAAVVGALRHLGLPARRPAVLASDTLTARQHTRLDHQDVSQRPIEAELMWLPIRQGEARLVWRFQLSPFASPSVFDLTVDAATGEVWTRIDWTSFADYRVYAQPAENPMLPTGIIPPDARLLAADPDLRAPNASPDGWHRAGNTNFTIMRGNNVHAYEDRDRNNAPPANQPDCGVNLVCDFPLSLFDPPQNYTDAAVTNLFYWTNLVHDIQYQYGFDEQAGNFQVNNFGRGGAGNDAVRAQAQDGDLLNNAFFTPFPDGQSPLLQMHEFTSTSPRRDSDLDNLFIVHEYGHGISQRQVGGPATVTCLGNAQQMGEGWSDWLGLVYTAEAADRGTDTRGIFNYVLAQNPFGPGARNQPYSTNPTINSYDYQSILNDSAQHAVGSVWAQVLWEVYWELVDTHGFDADLYDALGGSGNQRAMLYVNEGMQNTACSPSFLAARDGIIRAATDNHGSQDLCRVWETFAAFGMGVDATTGASNSFANVRNGFDKPQACCTAADNLPAPAFISTHDGDICQNSSALFETNAIAGADLYQWELRDGNGQLVRARVSAFPRWDIPGFQLAPNAYTLRVRASNECSTSGWRTVTVFVLPFNSPRCNGCAFGRICRPF